MNRTDTAVFGRERARLVTIAYGIIGDLGEAEDVVQEAWLRMRRTHGIEDVAGWLVVVTSRLALDVVRSARRRREDYVGPWLPEPLVDTTGPDPADRVTLDESVSTAMLVVLETLSPAERTAFVLREVFGHNYDDIADAVGRSPAAVRQLTARARRHLRENAPRFDADPTRHRAVAEAFATACQGRDLDALLELLDPDVVLRSDGGGVVSAARNPIVGADKVSRFLVGVAGRISGFSTRPVRVNGGVGALTFRGSRLHSATSLTIADGRVTAVDSVLHPDKLARTRALLDAPN
ncbi:RNA polymerase sigma factor SigJ [Allosaccharopolyspora coralli]|uniref:RNA polymerase sigma factor SigJ n=1 Tax=Allosaccharopolyspora coralli TaxID=2665642 RepID=UPI001E5896E6|nr:RNA polymerase sigma factor SigJ [Allosaccharopolyspora coralli]